MSAAPRGPVARGSAVGVRGTLAVLGIALVAAVAAWRIASLRPASPAVPPDVLPAFVDPPPGPRAPDVVMFGARPGLTTLGDVERWIRDRKLACRDTSARALMRDARAKAAEAPDAVDATSAASSKTGWSARELNPQVRLSCEGTPSSALADHARPPATGRLLFVHDSPAHPLRHVSYRRLHRDDHAAWLDVVAARDAVTAALGPPAEVTGVLPAEGGAFEPYAPWSATWRWVDLTVTVRASSYGARGIDVYEAAEVPWPVRSDARAEGRAAFARDAKQ